MKISIPSTAISFLTCLPIFIQYSLAGDADNLYDICPTDLSNEKIFINGLPCKNPSDIKPSDFKSSLLNEPGETDNFYGSSMIMATAAEFPGLNTLGISTARVDIEVDGTLMPHAHPRASEMMYVRSGVVVAGFLDSNDRVFQKGLKEGDVFVFPRGLLHYCFNAGFETATVFSVLNSQNPGLVRITGAMFAGSNVSEVVKGMVMKNSTSLEGFDLDGIDVGNLLGE
ncbi:germin-like protein subfamily 3 member 4 [Primulina huaijiensis]|uniref:germin-like protein subfamily 3 member 4 n=1 Tax=Primulina huaijiensis TaxID=1492673 RepID=UPI003CC774C5